MSVYCKKCNRMVWCPACGKTVSIAQVEIVGKKLWHFLKNCHLPLYCHYCLRRLTPKNIWESMPLKQQKKVPTEVEGL